MSEYHVAKHGCDSWPGTEKEPFLTISRAAALAKPGDRILVHEGTYREWVNPARGGNSRLEPIIYEAAAGEKAVIKGSEIVKDWIREEEHIWKATVPNEMFGNYNPYLEKLEGDWLIWPADHVLHTGAVYLNGKALYEASSLEELRHPRLRKSGMNPPWTRHPEPIPHPEETLFQWYAVVEDQETIIYANFQDRDPNQELVEIHVRKCCFYPERTGCNYITVRGFEMAQAACPWTPPTADQPGLLGTNWSKGWVIEQNRIHDAKCSGISIGKEASTGHNLCTYTHRKPGYQYQMEAVFRALQIGWGKETIGSHTIRGNVIYDCGQNGIVGHMGCIFSRIEENEIFRIGVRHEFFGYEIAGIKLHAAIDVQIFHNYIHHCTLGTWLDWQAQGARISGNLYRENDRDLMVEVTHGPYIVDNNIFASDYNFDNVAQGGAYLHNLCCGTMRREPVMDRSTPYHFPHTTQVAGAALVYSGDDRVIQNIFLGGAPVYTEQSRYGTEAYHGHTVSLEEYEEQVASLGNEDHEQFEQVKQPVYIRGNVYWKGASGFDREADGFREDHDPKVSFREEEDGVYLEMEGSPLLRTVKTRIYETQDLGSPRITEACYENPDGTAIRFGQDYLGDTRSARPTPGPLEELKEGRNHIQIWKRNRQGEKR